MAENAGIHVTLYFLCMSSFYGSRQRDPKLSWFYMVYITTNFIIGSIANALNVLLAETVFVDGRNVPGGALAALAIYDHLVITQVCFAFYMINSWTQDGLLVSTQLAKSRLSHRMFRTALSFLYNFWSTVNYRRHTFMSVYGLYQ